MPLYMDFHQFETISVEDVKKAHIADVAVQEKYGVRYIQFWVNEKAGSVFCLVEGPDPETCENCHKEAHGNLACNLQEVEPGFFKLFMGDGLPIDEYDLTLTKEGKTDPANRTLLVADIRGVTNIEDARDYKKLFIPTKSKNLVVDTLAAFNGRFIEHSGEDSLVGVFNSPLNAIRCAMSIQADLSRMAVKYGENSEWNVEYRLSLNNGQPLTPTEGFFEVATRQAKRLCTIAAPNQVTLSANLQNLYEMEIAASTSTYLPLVRILTNPEEAFLHALFDHTEQNLQIENFNVNNLCKLIGISRPQLYRKTTSLTGRSPNHFIKELRMQKAWNLLKSRKGNVSEVAMEVGYSNPSYFSKLFYENFGITPSSIMVS
ncbi:nickel-binding protein [Catalinimonas niigatensis]|uniref:nickel-binding protein n=1 Tax=Catalinimonas niigatensis TaxID=1397264 RepID=UPI0026656DD4|nr:nickel-binding protein [Catalinimonas niigatensis]WPP50741.1 DUF4242 domain-containing protein [Catalinimonas niigatensis]